MQWRGWRFIRGRWRRRRSHALLLLRAVLPLVGTKFLFCGNAGEDFGWQYALLPEGADGEGVVALGEADAVFVAEQVGVDVCDGGKAEGALEKDLAGGGLEQVGAADDLGDALVGVVDDAGELIAGQADVGWVVGEGLSPDWFSPDEEVAECFLGWVGGDAGGEGLRAEVCVSEADGFAVGDAEAVAGGGEGLRREVRGAAAAGVERLVVGMGLGVGVLVRSLCY